MVFNELIFLDDVLLVVVGYLEILQCTGSDFGEDRACNRAAMPFRLGVHECDKQYEFRRVRRGETDERRDDFLLASFLFFLLKEKRDKKVQEQLIPIQPALPTLPG